MRIVLHLDVMLQPRKMKMEVLAARIGIAEQNLAFIETGKVKGVSF
ncbi:MAG: helix-turn-helix domain-containing protein [Alteraurantiacibacter sp.]